MVAVSWGDFIRDAEAHGAHNWRALAILSMEFGDFDAMLQGFDSTEVMDAGEGAAEWPPMSGSSTHPSTGEVRFVEIAPVYYDGQPSNKAFSSVVMRSTMPGKEPRTIHLVLSGLDGWQLGGMFLMFGPGLVDLASNWCKDTCISLAKSAAGEPCDCEVCRSKDWEKILDQVENHRRQWGLALPNKVTKSVELVLEKLGRRKR